MRRTLGLLVASAPFVLMMAFWRNGDWFLAPRFAAPSCVAGVVLFGFGSLLCVLNAWLSLGRPLVYKLRFGSREGYRHISIIPLYGTLAVLFGV